MLSKLDDRILIQKAKQGDNLAFGELVRRYQHAVMRVARLRTKTLEDAADLAQETFLRAYRYLDRFKPEKRFVNWLLAIATNTAKTWMTHESRFVPLEETAEAVLNQRTYEIYSGEAIQRRFETPSPDSQRSTGRSSICTTFVAIPMQKLARNFASHKAQFAVVCKNLESNLERSL